MTNEALIASNPSRGFIAAAVGPVADVGIFIWALSAGLTLSAAHIVSFACAALLNYVLTVRASVSAAGRAHEPRLYVHLLVVALAVLFLRGGVLALLVSWGAPAQWAILLAVAVSTWLTRAGSSLCLSTGVWSLGGGVQWRALAFALVICAALLRLIYSSQVELLQIGRAHV